MNRQEVASLLMVVRREWPHSNVAAEGLNETIDHWLSVLGRVASDDAQRALMEMVASTREHAPRPGLIVERATARAVDVPDFDEAWSEIDRLKNRWNPAFPGRETPPADAFTHPAVAAFAVPAWRELCTGPAPATNGYGTFYAQQREAYRALAARAQRDTALEVVGAPRRRGQVGRAGDALTAEAVRLLGPGK